MKSISILTLLALVAAFATPNTAKAGDDEKALIGGLIGGLIIGAAIADNDHHTSIEVGYHGSSRHHDGYWTWTTRKHWVPGYYERRRDHCGNRVKVWVSGHYTVVREKVWVSERDRHYSRGHYDSSRHDHYRDNDHRRGGHRDRDDRRERRAGHPHRF